MLNNTPSKNQLVSGLTPRNTSKFLIHQTFNTDDSERTADNGYRFKMPEVWSSARSSNKSIAIRKIEWVPRNEFLSFGLVIEKQSDKATALINISLVIPERTPITDILSKIVEEFNKKKSQINSGLELCTEYDGLNLVMYVYSNADEEVYKIKICDLRDDSKASESFNRIFNQPVTMFKELSEVLNYMNVWDRCSSLHFHASFIPFDNYQYLGELGDLWQNPIIYQDPNGSPLFNVWITTDLKNRIPILHETFIFRFSFIIDVEKYYE